MRPQDPGEQAPGPEFSNPDQKSEFSAGFGCHIVDLLSGPPGADPKVQHECIPQAILGTDILCQAKSGMGKTAVFVLACLQQIDASEKVVRTLVICHTRELAYQIKHEFDRFAKYFADLKTAVVYGGMPIAKDRDMLKETKPQVLIGTPGRLLGLLLEKDLKLDKVTQFVLDECDKCLDKLDMRKDVQQIFIDTPKKKQVICRRSAIFFYFSGFWGPCRCRCHHRDAG